MDLDLTEYDQVDEAKFFIDQKNQMTGGGDLLTTISSEQSRSDEIANCENDFVFLPAPSVTAQAQTRSSATATTSALRETPSNNDADSFQVPNGQQANSNAIDGLTQQNNFAIQNQQATGSHQLLATGRFSSDTLKMNRQDLGQAPQRISQPLMAINTNGGTNPFHNLKRRSSDASYNSLTSPSSQPFWMRHEDLASKPTGLLEANSSPSSSQGANHLSDLMHQIVTKSDLIYIAIPCAFCHEPKACPPSDISAWLNHMNQVHNCKVCPICNKLVGLGPMRDIDIMRKHVVAHIDFDWLESKSPRTNFSTGLQNHWFSSGHCSVKDSQSCGRFK